LLEEKELIRMYVTIHLTFDTPFYTTFIRLTEVMNLGKDLPTTITTLTDLVAQG
jgi:hypothetical protein